MINTTFTATNTDIIVKCFGFEHNMFDTKVYVDQVTELCVVSVPGHMFMPLSTAIRFFTDYAKDIDGDYDAYQCASILDRIMQCMPLRYEAMMTTASNMTGMTVRSHAELFDAFDQVNINACISEFIKACANQEKTREVQMVTAEIGYQQLRKLSYKIS